MDARKNGSLCNRRGSSIELESVFLEKTKILAKKIDGGRKAIGKVCHSCLLALHAQKRVMLTGKKAPSKARLKKTRSGGHTELASKPEGAETVKWAKKISG